MINISEEFFKLSVNVAIASRTAYLNTQQWSILTGQRRQHIASLLILSSCLLIWHQLIQMASDFVDSTAQDREKMII